MRAPLIMWVLLAAGLLALAGAVMLSIRGPRVAVVTDTVEYVREYP